VSAHAPQETRRHRIEDRERRSRGGLLSDVEIANLANELVAQDSKEVADHHGQNVRDAFPLGDVFIDATSRQHCEDELRRFIKLLFGNNEVTPTHDEYGMYMAKSASLRSSDLSRQVGAAIFRQSGEIVSLGCNEVPKAGGGTYWTGQPRDARDFVTGHDPNHAKKVELLVDLLERLRAGNHLAADLQSESDGSKIAERLLTREMENSVSNSKVMDIIEFNRTIHAEMSAIMDAARNGIAVKGGTLYCTTFPCHICAKHIVASGVLRMVYLEPYPKSYASDLHGDSIAVDPDSATDKVRFEAFIGVSPFRYRDLFEKGKRKYSSGAAQQWNDGARRPMIDVYFPSYFRAETYVVGRLSEALERLLNEAPSASN
jgi:cytidine deaminase